MNTNRGLKIVFSAYAAAVGITILSIVSATFFLGFSRVDYLIDNFMIPFMLVVTVILLPVMHKYLK